MGLQRFSCGGTRNKLKTVCSASYVLQLCVHSLFLFLHRDSVKSLKDPFRTCFSASFCFHQLSAETAMPFVRFIYYSLEMHFHSFDIFFLNLACYYATEIENGIL